MKTQAKSALVVCEYCNKEVRKRGLVSHIRLQHQIQIPKVQPGNASNPDFGKALKELDKIDRKIKKLRKQFVQFQKLKSPVENILVPNEVPVIKEMVVTSPQKKESVIPEKVIKVPEITTEEPKTETEELKEQSYTTEDVQILMGKIFVEQKRFSYLTTKDPFLETELEGRLKVIIDDFEKRFHCKYKDLQKEFPDYQPTKNPKKWKLRYIQLSWFSKDNYSK